MITSFNAVFEHKLKKLRDKLKLQLLDSEKRKDRNRTKSLLKEAKYLRDLLKGRVPEHSCPKCGHTF